MATGETSLRAEKGKVEKDSIKKRTQSNGEGTRSRNRRNSYGCGNSKWGRTKQDFEQHRFLFTGEGNKMVKRYQAPLLGGGQLSRRILIDKNFV